MNRVDAVLLAIIVNEYCKAACLAMSYSFDGVVNRGCYTHSYESVEMRLKNELICRKSHNPLTIHVLGGH